MNTDYSDAEVFRQVGDEASARIAESTKARQAAAAEADRL